MRIPLEEIPIRMRKLALNESGYPVPWFVAWIDGKPDFRVIGPGKFERAVRFKRCWVCGEQLGKHQAFVIGPMCAITRTTSEPPCHTECAIFSATHCPFMIDPAKERRETNLPEDGHDPPGFGLTRNPGVGAVWVTEKGYKLFNAGDGALITMGDPSQIFCYARGRAATMEEITASIDSGLPKLREMAELDGEKAVAELDRMVGELNSVLFKHAGNYERYVEAKGATGGD